MEMLKIDFYIWVFKSNDAVCDSKYIKELNSTIENHYFRYIKTFLSNIWNFTSNKLLIKIPQELKS